MLTFNESEITHSPLTNQVFEKDYCQIADGAYDPNYDLQFYIIDNRLYFDEGNQNYIWNTSTLYGAHDEIFKPEYQVIGKPGDPSKYYTFFIELSHAKTLTLLFYYNEIWYENDEWNVSPRHNIINNTDEDFPIAFALGEEVDEKRTLFASSGPWSTGTVPYPAGLGKWEVTANGINFIEYILSSDDPGYDEEDFYAYNLEYKVEDDGDEVIVWVNQHANCNEDLYVVVDGVGQIHELNLGRIGGVEFSSLEDNIVYVSTPTSGIVKVNYNTGSIIDIDPLSNDYGHTFLQTAPDGHIYGVANDGKDLGQINMSSGNFTQGYFPIPGNGYDYVSSFREFSGTKFYVLPENHRTLDPLVVSVDVTDETCPGYADGTATICVSGGTPGVPPNPEYTIICNGPQGLVSNITYDPASGCFYISGLSAGFYTFEITDKIGTYYAGDFLIEEYNYDLEYVEINSSVPWYPQYPLHSKIEFGILVKSGATLTIDNAYLEFGPEGKIIIEPGAKIVSESSTFRNIDCDPQQKWKGIEVWGNKSQPQRLPDGSYPQGILEIHNCTILNAENGAAVWALESNNWKSSGGIVKAYGSTFKNNTKAVHFIPYQNFQTLPGGGTIPRKNLSHFKHCIFTLDNQYIDNTMFWKHVDLHGVNGIEFIACDFTLSAINGVATWNNGIASYGSGFTAEADCDQPIVPCPEHHINPCFFSGFYRAISAHGPLESITTYEVFDSYFTNNAIGIYNTEVFNAVMVDNEFRIGYNSTTDNNDCEDASSSGIEVFSANGFAIERNYFTKIQGAPTGNYVGVRLNNTESIADDVYKNELVGLSTGNIAEGNNRSEWDDDHKGVAYFCNENSNNNYDIHVAENSKIRGYIGSVELSSGNILSQDAVLQINNKYTEDIRYYYYDDEPYHLQVLSSFSAYVIPYEVEGENSCPNHYGGGTGINVLLTSVEKGEKQQEYDQNMADYLYTLDLIGALKDGGDTPLMKHEVETAWPNEMWELRATLLANSPHLSFEVLKDVADRCDVFPESVQFEIFAANPDEMNHDFLTYLETKLQPMPQYMVDMLRQIGYGSSYKTVLKNQLATYNGNAIRAAQDILRSELCDSVSDMDEIRLWLSNIGGYQADKQIIASYLQDSNYVAAQSILEQLPTNYDLSGEELLAYSDYYSLVQLQINLMQQNRNICELDSSELYIINTIATEGYGSAKKQAQGILEYAYNQHFYNCPALPDSLTAKQHQMSNIGIRQNAIEVSIKPNPAQTWVAFDYSLPFNAEKGVIIIIDITGQVIEKINLDQNNGQTVLDTRHLQAGVYIYKIESSGYSNSGKLVIQ